MESRPVPTRSAAPAAAEARVSVFMCANCAREAVDAPARLNRPSHPAIPFPRNVEKVIVPCAGRLQPEHVLRAIETGADLVCVIACEEDNCHFLEGSCRAERRIKYIHGLLEDIGMDSRCVMLCHLPGSAREDMALGASHAPRDVKPVSHEQLSKQLAAVAAQVAERLGSLSPNPLHNPRPAVEEAEMSEVAETEESDE